MDPRLSILLIHVNDNIVKCKGRRKGRWTEGVDEIRVGKHKSRKHEPEDEPADPTSQPTSQGE